MKSIRTYAVIGAALAAAGGLAAIDASGNAQQADAATLAFTAKPAGFNQIDLGRKGLTPGDQFVEHGTVSGTANGAFALTGEFIAGNQRRGMERSTLSLKLPSGTIEAAGIHGLVEKFTLAVVGGTGSYAGARGTLSVSPAKKGASKVTIALQ
jgi:hypothetical protein